ncbi:MAG: hypothetical protein ACXW50_21285 [Candidatus Binatia bacterium]
MTARNLSRTSAAANRLMNRTFYSPRGLFIIDSMIVGGLALAFTLALLVFVSTSANARYIKDDGHVRQLYLCFFVADRLGKEEAKMKFLKNADYHAITSGWSTLDLATYKGYIYGKFETKLDQSRFELAKMYADLGCDILVNRPIVTRDE